MKKLFIFLQIAPTLYFSQVGINTSNPQQIFHVDGKIDNPATGTPTLIQQSNDFVISTEGNIGVGITNPSARFHLYNHAAGTDSKNNYFFDDESPIINDNVIYMRRSNGGTNLSSNNMIGSLIFNAKTNGNFGFLGSGIRGIYKGNGTVQNSALAFLINNSAEAGRFDESGNFIIGNNTAALAKLQVQGNAFLNAILSKPNSDVLTINTGLDGFGYGNRAENFGILMKTFSSLETGNIARINFGDISTGIGNLGSRYLSFSVGKALNELLYLTDQNGGNVGIGTVTPSQKLDVIGNIRATGSLISGTTTYPDYVFEDYYKGSSVINPSYEFKKLDEVEQFIKKKGHLPGYQSLQEIKQKNMIIDVTQNSITNMEKIEELYLHVIELNNKIKYLEEKNASLEKFIYKNCSK